MGRSKRRQADSLQDDQPQSILASGSHSSQRSGHNQEENSSGNLKYIFLLFGLFSLSSVISLVALLDLSGTNDSSSRLQTIATVDWSDVTLQSLAKNGRPVILENTPLEKWPCINWTWRYLRENLKVDLPVKVSRSPIFKYSTPDKPYSGVTANDSDFSYTNVIMKAGKLVERLEAGGESEYLYTSGETKLLDLSRDFGSVDSVTFPSPSEQTAQVNFWLGGQGVVADWHYDTSDNLHGMIMGQKTFTLRPPREYIRLGLFPSIHRYYRQTQVRPHGDFESRAIPLESYEVTLQHGQVIYIPPYWFHTVETHVASVSVNAWSHSEAFLTMEEVYRLAIPLEGSWARCKLLYGAWIFVGELLQNLLPQRGQSAAFLSRTLLDRYKLFLPSPDHDTVDASDVRRCADEGSDLLTGENKEQFVRSITGRTSSHLELFLTMPLAVRQINLGNFVEHLYANVLGEESIQLMPVALSLEWPSPG